ncbi:GTP-binding protein [Gracilibacillus salitolerans]|uniref:GTP-binding protein n=1 Tax=Gracilibacillus salitolerans TaxID=2663022 RepID=A0A5Q2TF65_9BACI|nr:GTPase domain-containing protein [Gracilibacillus salitolerans]QGH33296.1 GTP-binding protein [Gracilibacillus salitolerans]
MEKQLISKSYYHTFIDGIKDVDPIKILGELYIDEQQNEMPDLSYIRFAQGEVYFLYKDYESAIFKWENVSNELKPWAQKNIADAHAKMNLLAIAEDYYNSVETDSEVLKTEVLLQLFSLYIQLGKHAKAVDSIKYAVDINPDYPDVTDVARVYFEDEQDWDNAVELAVNEAMRTNSLPWFVVLEEYVEHGHTVKINPNYFSEVLMTLYNIDQNRFESLSTALWNSYKQTDLYFPWLEEINNLLLSIEPERSYVWRKLSNLFRVTYFELMNGKFLIKEFSYLIPGHLNNWMKVSTGSDALIAASAVLAWSEIYPSNMEASIISEAESLLSQSVRYQNGIEDGFKLFKSIMKWAEREGLLLDKRFEWIVHELQDLNQYHLMITGTETSGKSSFVNTLLGEELSEDPANATILYKDADNAKIHAITNEEERSIAERNDFKESTKKQQTFISCRMPVSFLNENNLTLIDTPGLTDQDRLKNDGNHYLSLADSLLFVLNADSNLTGNELDMAVRIKEQAPDLPIHFLLCKMDRNTNSQEAMERTERIISRIEAYFPNAKAFTFSANEDSKNQINEFSAFTRSMMAGHSLEDERASKILYYIKKSIKYLLLKREEVENSLIDNIKWNEEIVTKLKGAQNQLSDIEENTGQVIKKSYSKIIEEWKQDLTKKIPELIRKSSEVINEDSDFGKIHNELNNEINKRINNYIEEAVLPDLHVELQEWIENSERELHDSQAYLGEMSESFNDLYGEEKVYFECDSRVLDDWHRDIDRMTRGNIQLTKATFMSDFTISQFFWKSAGKLVGALSKNKETFHDKYKQYIEGKDYSKTVETIIDEFMQQFELFEKSLERDIKIFFTDPYDVLDELLAETYDEIEENKDVLSDMQKKPELYRNPITLFEIKLRQYEWMFAESERIYENS